MKKDGKGHEIIPEDDPEKYKHAIYVMVMKVSQTFVQWLCSICHLNFVL